MKRKEEQKQDFSLGYFQVELQEKKCLYKEKKCTKKSKNRQKSAYV
jgi:hypothetical protein